MKTCKVIQEPHYENSNCNENKISKGDNNENTLIYKCNFIYLLNLQ